MRYTALQEAGLFVVVVVVDFLAVLFSNPKKISR
jgi:hypothetical protein